MTFLSLVVALLLEQWRPLRSGNPVFIAFTRYVNALARNLNAGRYRDGIVAWLLLIVPVALIAAAGYFGLRRANPLLALAWNVVVLYLALGFRQFSHFFTDILHALQRGELPKARELVAVWRGRSAQELQAGEIARVTIELGLVRSHRHVFGVMMWFAAFGAAGAIAYRLAAVLHDRWSENGGEPQGVFGEFAVRAFAVMDWVPVRLTALAFAIAGDFMGAVECWREQAPRWRPAAHGIVLASAAGALGVRLGGELHEYGTLEYRPELGSGDEADTDYMQAAVGLMWRALVLWLFLIALTTIASWF
jgi:adenosylcobinamide-phosphate synthase